MQSLKDSSWKFLTSNRPLKVKMWYQIGLKCDINLILLKKSLEPYLMPHVTFKNQNDVNILTLRNLFKVKQFLRTNIISHINFQGPI